MAKSKLFSKRKPTGGRYKPFRKKKVKDIASEPTLTRLGKLKLKKVRVHSAYIKTRTLTSEIANVYDPKSKKYKKAKILTIVENPANQHYVRRNIMTKGTVIETELGKAKITSRPGQEGTINAVLI
ncbi:MAG: 30S ribosomal protein S8e [Nanoarchaeota archaeon]